MVLDLVFQFKEKKTLSFSFLPWFFAGLCLLEICSWWIGEIEFQIKIELEKLSYDVSVINSCTGLPEEPFIS